MVCFLQPLRSAQYMINISVKVQLGLLICDFSFLFGLLLDLPRVNVGLDFACDIELNCWLAAIRMAHKMPLRSKPPVFLFQCCW